MIEDSVETCLFIKKNVVLFLKTVIISFVGEVISKTDNSYVNKSNHRPILVTQTILKPNETLLVDQSLYAFQTHVT